MPKQNYLLYNMLFYGLKITQDPAVNPGFCRRFEYIYNLIKELGFIVDRDRGGIGADL